MPPPNYYSAELDINGAAARPVSVLVSASHRAPWQSASRIGTCGTSVVLVTGLDRPAYPFAMSPAGVTDPSGHGIGRRWVDIFLDAGSAAGRAASLDPLCRQRNSRDERPQPISDVARPRADVGISA